MPSIEVRTPRRLYHALVERGALERLGSFFPEKAGRVFVVTEESIWRLHSERIERGMAGRPFEVLRFPGGEENKRLESVELLAEQMIERGGDRTSVVIAFGGGVVNDVAGFLAAIFMRGVAVIQAPTTLLAQVDAAIGGKTGVNLQTGKNLVGAFHQPLAVLIDPDVLATLPEREYRAGLFEIIKCGVIRSPELFLLMTSDYVDVLARAPRVVDRMIEESVRIKAEVVSADEREGDLRRILNFGHTLGHALEAETAYSRFLHGEAVAFGMRAAVYLAEMTGYLSAEETLDVLNTIALYGPIPSLDGIRAERLVARLASDKKTVQGKIHFVLPEKIGRVKVVSGIEEKLVLAAAQAALA
jgi:3-dehydroquinate synthase